jgi:hypothetical protein
MKKKIIVGLCSTALLVLVGCGGGGSGSTSSSTGIELSKGTITGFGSVFVNGIRFDTDNAIVKRDNEIIGDVTNLNIGMVVTVAGSSTTAIATSVTFDEDIKGPLDFAISDFSNPLFVMGQTVITDDNTIIHNSINLPLTAGDILEISGLRQMGDSILATYIETKSITKVKKFEVVGNVRSLDVNSRTFKIGDLTVDYSVAVLDDFNGGGPTEGQLLEVKDSNLSYVAGSNSLLATKIEPVNPFGESDSSSISQIEIETVVIELVSAGIQFKIPNFTVNIRPETQFRYGIAADLGIGSVIEVKARVATNGELNATRITFKRNSARLDAPVEVGSIDITNNRLTLLGITVQITSDTQLRDKRDDTLAFNINDIRDNDYLEVRGYKGPGSNSLIATRLERENTDNNAEIRGIATNVDTVSQKLEIMGVIVTADSGTQFENAQGTLVSASSFFTAITSGLSVVEAKWEPFSDTNFSPKELELEDDYSNNNFESEDD